MSDLKHTQRGFAYIEFQDRYEHKCSIQKSSLATEDAIWFGIDDANPQVLHGDARRLGIETDATSGWVPYPLPAEVSLATRMHLTQDQVCELLPTLIHFAETGDVLAPADCRPQPEATAPAQDLSAAILGIRFNADYSDPKLQSAFDRGCDEALVAAAALASSANALSAVILPKPFHFTEKGAPLYTQGQLEDCIKNALSAGYRVDAEKWRYIVKDGKALDGKFTLVMCQPDGSVKELHGTEYDAAISAAILQSQKGNKA